MFKVILVDDEPFALEGIKLMVEWEELGFEIVEMCENGEEALACIEACKPDLVVTDIRMPVIDGLELIDRVQKAGNDPVFIILSGYNDFEYARSALRYGVKHYLLKPALDREWEAVIQLVIGELQHREQQRVRQDLVADRLVPTLLAQMLRGEISATDGNVGEILDPLAQGDRGWRYIHVEWLSGSEQELDARYFLSRKAHAIDLFGNQEGLVMPSVPDIEEWAQQVYEDLREQGIECCLSIGPRVDSLRHIEDSYAGALETSVHHFFHISGGPLDYDKINHKQVSYDLNAVSIVDDIQSAIEALQDKRVEDLIKQMFVTLSANKTAREVVHLLVIRIVLKSATVMREMGIDSEALPRVRDFLRREHRSLKEVEESLQAYVQQYMSQLKQHKEKFSGHPLRVIERFIQEHYRETLTIKEIGERFFMNPVYLGQAFMKRNGVGIIEYIHDLRINAAKRMLCESDETIRLIAEQIGYVHYHHFLKEFEKRVSNKPAVFRQLSKA
ncbi:response regulator transcription factor [Paenibacillus aceris]|uniref:Two-component system response regulator YesN n=1 Tax=Paenibacillus aceris TaxID=869555 RepID=A0ABS4I5D9_9BACL|nr:response regulator [Paenibacillus aceris]MBP1966132.1 two-component system response regulator YesN [Paenibacillus aceris]NHW33291.1 response regulator [Paenibacillus aceris]